MSENVPVTDSRFRCGCGFETDDSTPWFLHPRHCAIAEAALAAERARCSDCGEAVGKQHRPSCHRQGLVTDASVYDAPRAGEGVTHA